MQLAVSDQMTSTTREIAESTGISLRFLEQIVIDLRRSGLTASRRGAGGGHRLTVSPDDLRVGEVVSAVAASGHDRVTSELSALDQLWLALDVEVQDFLDAVTIADLVAGELPAWAADRARRALAGLVRGR